MNDIGDRLRRLPADTLGSLAFFSRLPVRASPGAFDMRRSAAGWPLAGLLLAILPAGVYWLAIAAGSSLAPLIAIAVLMALTGAMHEDGLADTADGFGGGRTREAKLAIMRDSRLGTYGALALLFSVLIRTAGLSSFLYPGYPAAALALLLTAVLSRSMALWHWHGTLPAREDGMARAAGRPDGPALAIGLATGALAAIVLLVAFSLAGLLAILLAAVGTTLFTSLCRRQIGGHTGDTIGAAQQIAEMLLFLGLSTSWYYLTP